MDRFTKFIFVAVGLFSGPGIIFLLPYIVPQESYAAFAKVLTLSQLLALVGGLGLEIGGPRLNMPVGRVTGLLMVTTSIAATILFSVSPSLTITEGMIALSVGCFTALGTVYQSYFLFKGHAQNYGLYGLCRSVVALLVLFALLKMGQQASISWGVATSLGFIASLWFVKNIFQESGFWKGGDKRLVDILKFSLPFYAINGAAVLPVILDRFMSQRNLGSFEFSKYMVVTTWAIPILYLGNVYQQYLISHLEMKSVKVFLGKILLLLSSSIVYIVAVIFAVKYFVPIPYFEDANEFVPIWMLVAGWYAVYAAVAYPSAAYVQKRMSESDVRSLALWTAAIFPLALVGAYLLASIWWAQIGMYAAVIFSVLFASLMLAPRVFFVGRLLSKELH